MKYLFLDNFRGFSNTWIPVTDVNFLVGQNSTGKTSVLSLLKLLSDPSFLFGESFVHDYVSFGRFSDIVSAHAADKKYFRIGLAWEESGKKKNDRKTVAWLLTYVEDAGMPRVSRYTYLRGTSKISLIFSRGGVSFKKGTSRSPVSVSSVIDELIPRWVSEHSSGSGYGYDKLELPPSFPRRLPLFMALSFIPEAERPSKKTSKLGDTEIIIDAIDDSSNIAFAHGMVWIAPIRMKPQRSYDALPLQFSSEGAHTPHVIRRMLRSKKAAVRFRAFLKRVGKESDLFEGVEIKDFGGGSETPFEVDIVIDGKALNLINVGYGVSQSLPVLVEVVVRPHGTWFAIQQPEVHLHPRAQAALGDVLFEMAASDHKSFLIETHSDFMIDRFRLNYRKMSKSRKPDSQILFFERKDKQNVVTPLLIGDSGDLPAAQPDSYREFFVKEQMNLLGI
ncbi:MAG: AAA family ATPase [Candidatus Korobacteraceae bacterium]